MKEQIIKEVVKGLKEVDANPLTIVIKLDGTKYEINYYKGNPYRT